MPYSFYTNHSNNVAPTPEVGKYVTVTGTIATFNGLRQIKHESRVECELKIPVVTDTSRCSACYGRMAEDGRGAYGDQSMLYTPSSDAGFTSHR